MKFLIFVFSFFLVLACKEKEPTPNRPPGEFTVKSTLGTDGKTVTLNWTKAKDPDGDAVTYTVVLGSDTLAKGLTDTVYVLKNLNYDFSGSGSILAYDSKKLITKVDFNLATNENPIFSIPDKNFEQYLVDFMIDKDGLVNGKMAKDDAKGVKELYCVQREIQSLVGIDNFVDLEILMCSSNKLTGLDVSKNVNLVYLWCYDNQIVDLDLSKNLNLILIYCHSNLLTTLYLSKNVNLEWLNCQSNKLTSLDLSNIENLKFLFCGKNPLKTICVHNLNQPKSNWEKDPAAEYKTCI